MPLDGSLSEGCSDDSTVDQRLVASLERCRELLASDECDPELSVADERSLPPVESREDSEVSVVDCEDSDKSSDPSELWSELRELDSFELRSLVGSEVNWEEF